MAPVVVAPVAAAAPETPLEHARRLLAPFLALNPDAKVETIVAPINRIGIRMPWGDPSFILLIPAEVGAFADALNNLYLPPRFTAIWHRDTKDLEVIWTAYKISESVGDIPARRFQFEFDGAKYACEFARSSDRLLTLAKGMRPVGGSDTTYRNLQSYSLYATIPAEGRGKTIYAQTLGEPLSFFIRNIEWAEDRVIELISNLNFFMVYFDSSSPHVLIHSPQASGVQVTPRKRFIKDSFPERISAKPIDDNLLHFWVASREGDAARRFTYCYRIIEYAASLYLDSSARAALRKILAAPDALSDTDDLTEKVVAAIQRSKLDEVQKCAAVLMDTVDPALLWEVIEKNLAAFATETVFEGGFKAPPLVAVGSRREDFAPQGIASFARVARDIRNALSHGRDQKTTLVIAPTVHNFNRLLPWVNLISAAAAEVILYHRVT